MKIKLSVLNRLSFVGLLPEIGNHATLKINRELREELGLTEEEHKSCNFRPVMGTKMSWDDEAVLPKEFEFDEGSVREMLFNNVQTQLQEMEKKGTLKLELDSLYVTLCLETKEELKIVEK